MLDRDKWTAIYLGIAYLAFAEISSLGGSSQASPCIVISEYQPTNYQPSYQACAALHEEVMRVLAFLWEHTTHDNISAAATVVIAIFTLTLWRSTYNMWVLGTATAERQLRAYLTTAVGQCLRQTRTLNLEFRPIILNTGQTPAYDVYILNSMALLSPTEATNYDFRIPEQPPATLMTLGPRQERFTHVIAGRKMTRNEMREWIAHRKLIFVYGTIHYRDAFQKPRFTNFCYSILYWSKRGTPLWHNTNRHNESN
ncbi:MAG TPA: hypothetical protein VK430_06805 [Xanthobacteraceae bacterium]|nr:hypothetical protein [Xanthobacteraceae bacterium]